MELEVICGEMKVKAQCVKAIPGDGFRNRPTKSYWFWGWSVFGGCCCLLSSPLKTPKTFPKNPCFFFFGVSSFEPGCPFSPGVGLLPLGACGCTTFAGGGISGGVDLFPPRPKIFWNTFR